MAARTECLWVLLLVSKFKALSSSSSWSPNYISISLIFFIIGAWVSSMCFVYWAYPGGPAWGKHYFRNSWYCSSSKAHQNPIPGPRGLPVIGSMNIMANLPHQKLALMAQMFRAKRLMAFSLGDTRVIITSNPDVAKEILNSSAFADRPVKESAYTLMFNRAMGFAPFGVYWRTLRKIAATHLFSPLQMKNSESQRLKVASQLIQELVNYYYKTSTSNGTTSYRIRELLKRASLNNMMGLVFGREYKQLIITPLSSTTSISKEAAGELAAELVEEGYDLLGQLNWSDHLPWVSSFDLQNIRLRCSKLVPRVHELVGPIISDHRQYHSTDISGEEKNHHHHHDFVDVLLSQQQAHNNLSDTDIIAVLWEMIFRGTDTVAVSIEWILARMVLHQDIQSRVHQELDEVVGNSRAVSESDIPALVYLQAVVKEVLRLHPPGPLLSWARLATTDVTIDGLYYVPAGTTAMVNMWAITRDPSVWTDPLEFVPERFMTTTRHHPDHVDFSVMGSDLRLAPFGSGRRTCPGKVLGLTTVTFWVASILHKFHVLESDSNRVDLSEVLKLSCEMANPLKPLLRPRF